MSVREMRRQRLGGGAIGRKIVWQRRGEGRLVRIRVGGRREGEGRGRERERGVVSVDIAEVGARVGRVVHERKEVRGEGKGEAGGGEGMAGLLSLLQLQLTWLVLLA